MTDKKQRGYSIAKYCNVDELTELATRHKSIAVRFVAFKLLLKKDSHRAIKVVIDHIDDNDSITAFHLDEGFPRLLSGLRVGYVQGDRKIYNISVADSLAVVDAVLKSKNKSKFYDYSSMGLRAIIGNRRFFQFFIFVSLFPHQQHKCHHRHQLKKSLELIGDFSDSSIFRIVRSIASL